MVGALLALGATVCVVEAAVAWIARARQASE